MNDTSVNELFDELDIPVHEKWTSEDKWEQIRLLAILGRTLVSNDKLYACVRHRVTTSLRYDKEAQ